MMGRALLIIGLLGTAGLLASAGLGYFLPGPTGPEMQRHVLAGLAAVLLILFSHCWVLLYLLGTGRAMRDAIQQFSLAPDLLEQAGRSLKAVTPGLLVSMGLVMATFAVGGAVAGGSLPRWSHHTLFYATLAVQLWTLWQENRVLAGNEALMAEVGRRIGDPQPPSQVHA